MKIFRKILKYFALSACIAIFLITAVYFFVQTETFNRLALNYTLSSINNSETWLMNENAITVESVNGNILNGLRVNNILVTVKKDTLASISHIDLKYDIWGLLNQKIGVEYLIINSPEINLFKVKSETDSSEWNFLTLFPPSTDTTPAPRFNWDIYVSSLKIENGRFKILDDIPLVSLWVPEWEKQNEFEFNKLYITGLQLDMAGEYSEKLRKINLRNLSFKSNTDVVLEKLSFEADINTQDTSTQIRNFELLTDRSDIKMNSFTAKGFNPLDSSAFDNYENKKVSVILNTGKFDFDDVKYFLPDVDMMGSISSLNLDAGGTLKNMNVNNLSINLPGSNFNFKGNVKNIDNTDSMYMDIISSNKIDPADIKTIYYSKSIPEFRKLGIVFADIDYRGTYYDFCSSYNIRSGSGNIKGNGHMNIKDDLYGGNVITNNLNLANILNDRKWKSNINIDAGFEGSGYSLNSMSAGIRYTLRNSSAAGYSILSSSGTVNINRNNIGLNIKANSVSGNAVVSGKVNISNLRNPVYTIKGTVNNLDVSGLTRNSRDKSNLNAGFVIDGRGINLNSLSGRYNFDIGNSYYSEYNIPSSVLDASLGMESDISSLHLTSKALEVKADGTFDIYSFIDALLYNISVVSNITEKKLNPDSTFIYPDLSGYKHAGNLNLNYNIKTKDSAELSKLTLPFGFIFNGEINGNVTNSPDVFNSKSVIHAINFKYHDTTIILNNLKSNIALTNDYANQNNSYPLSSFRVNMDVNAEKLKFNSFMIDSVNADLRLSEAVANLKVRGKLDSVKYLRLISEIDLRGNGIVMNIDSLYAKYNTYEVENTNKMNIIYNPQSEVIINRFGMKLGKMYLNVDGIYSLTGSSDINIKGENMNIGEIYAMIQPFDTTETGERNIFPVDGELQNFYVNLTGTPDNANIFLDVKTNILKYDTMSVGTIVANVQYKDRILTPDIMITNNGNKGSLKITGNIPFENLLIKKDTMAAVADRLSDLHFAANNFQIQYFSKFIPGVGDLRGILNGTLDATGTLYKPDLKGNLTMVQGKYFWDFTGMYYDYKFKISTENSNLVLDYLSLYNTKDDTRHIDLFGNVDFKGYNLNKINLTASGNMVILDNSGKENQLGLKGYLLGGIGTPAVTISGNTKKLNIKGQFLVIDASIKSLPNSGKGYQIDDKNMIYMSANDSALTSDTNRRRITLNEYNNLNPFVRNRYILIDTTKNFSIMNILSLDIDVKTVKNIYVSIDFKNLTRDRLYGDIAANLRLRSDSGRLRAQGEVDIVGNSYYRFYRYFKVKNSKITFRGPIDKPELDIRAVYENTKSTNQFGTITNSPIQVVLTVNGEPSNPVTTLKLYENGTEMHGNDATSDAITFLLFGKYKNELSASETQSVASGIGSTIGSLYVTSFFGQVVRDILPFIKDAEVNYSEGGIQNTSVNASADILDANVTVGSRVISNIAYLEFNVEYPLNNLIHLNLPEKVLLHIAREQLSRNVISNSNVYYSTGMKLIYKLKF